VQARRFLAVLVLISSCLVCGALYHQATAPNNLILKDYENALGGIEHPMGTTRINSFSKVGWLSMPYPEECNFLVAEARQYTMPQKEIRAFYQPWGLVENVTTQKPEIKKIEAQNEYGYVVDLRVIFSDYEGFGGPCDDLAHDWSLVSVCHWAKRKIDEDQFYIVMVTSLGREAGNDPRCGYNWLAE
jgi:hypothetical protein